MKTVGIICEYNPFHNGHRRQIELIREKYGEGCTVVCLMSGNFVQRGAPAIVDKSIRAKAAVLSGADLVLELPVCAALSSAEGFAAGGVRLLSGICDVLCFGTESMAESALFRTAGALLSPRFSELLKAELSSGCSFPAARQRALAQMGIVSDLCNPNDILGLEYTKAILSQHSSMEIFPIFREGSYHAQELNSQAPSATAIRINLLSGGEWQNAVPAATVPLLQNASLHTLEAGERAILARLRTMTDEEFEHSGPMINTDVFNQIKAKRRIITEEEEARTKAFVEDDDFKKVETDTISRDLLKGRTAAFNFNDKEKSSRNNYFDDLLSDD